MVLIGGCPQVHTLFLVDSSLGGVTSYRQVVFGPNLSKPNLSKKDKGERTCQDAQSRQWRLP